MTKDWMPNPDAKKCSARRTNGQPCGAWAIKGGTVCRVHGGSVPKVREAANRRYRELMAKRQLTSLGLEPMDVSPSQALLDEVRWTATHVAWLRQKVQELNPEMLTTVIDGQVAVKEGSHPLVFGVTRQESGDSVKVVREAQPSVWYDLYMRERDHLVKASTAALRAGIEERRVQLEEAMGYQVFHMINTVLETLWSRVMDSGQTPTRELWEAAVVDVLPRALKSISAA